MTGIRSEDGKGEEGMGDVIIVEKLSNTSTTGLLSARSISTANI